MYNKQYIKVICGFVLLAITQLGNTQNNNDLEWLKNQIKQHPDIIAAKARLESDLFQAENLAQSLYNPSIISEYEREGSTNNYLVGLSQTFDRNNKHSTNQALAKTQRRTAKLDYNIIFLNKLSQALQAIIQHQAINKQASLLMQQEKQLENLLELVNKRTNSGDLGQLDAQLAYLSLSQGFGQSATIEARLKQNQARLSEQLVNWQGRSLLQFSLKKYQIKEVDDLVKNHPIVKASYTRWQQTQSQAELARKNKKNDPSFGIGAGKINKDNLLTLSFSMPLNLRRNFDAAYLSANQQMAAAESNYLATSRKQKFAIQASLDSLKAFENRYKKWQVLMQGQDESFASLLQKQWQLGDISTTNYLLTLQQRTQGLLAGIELEQNYKIAIINYLTDTAQLSINTTTNIKEVSP